SALCQSRSTSLSLPSLFFSCYRALRHLHSFPTRRSSDLLDVLVGERTRRVLGVDDESADELPLLDQRHGQEGELIGALIIYTKEDRKSTRLNSSHVSISYAVFCLKKKKKKKKK